MGRLSLFRLLGNNSSLERYDREKEAWLALSSTSIYEVEKAVEIARKKRVSSLLFLPVGAVSKLQGDTLLDGPAPSNGEEVR